MTEENLPRWLEWAREIQAISQTGLAYSDNEYNNQRYRRLAEIAAEIVESHTGLPKEPLLENFLSQPGYATPKVGVRGAVVCEGKILLVREIEDGGWCMPGGWADVGERPSAVAAREVFEESGIIAVPRTLVGVYDANRREPLPFYHAYKLVFLCDRTGGELKTSNETSDVGFFSPDNLPPLSWERTNERHIADVFKHWREPGLPAEFD
ncbi:NUDIX hydrolase [bacterium]|nr:NUDIX hydrolase [bacterium]